MTVLSTKNILFALERN